MRLTKDIQNKLIEYSQQYFGENTHLYLFGSRVDDEKKGGDIDLFLETPKDIELNIQLAFLRDIYTHVTQRKVDLIIKSPAKKDRPIYHTAKSEGILLC